MQYFLSPIFCILGTSDCIKSKEPGIFITLQSSILSFPITSIYCFLFRVKIDNIFFTYPIIRSSSWNMIYHTFSITLYYSLGCICCIVVIKGMGTIVCIIFIVIFGIGRFTSESSQIIFCLVLQFCKEVCIFAIWLICISLCISFFY